MEGSTREGEGFVARLWEKANARFDEIAPLISGTPRLWGLMTGPNRDFMPWEDGFSRGAIPGRRGSAPGRAPGRAAP